MAFSARRKLHFAYAGGCGANGFTIAVLSETYLKSEYTQPEWAAAFAQNPTGKKRKLIPVRVAECALTGMLAPIIYIDFVGLGEQDAERALLDGLKPSGKPVQPQPEKLNGYCRIEALC